MSSEWRERLATVVAAAIEREGASDPAAVRGSALRLWPGFPRRGWAHQYLRDEVARQVRLSELGAPLPRPAPEAPGRMGRW